MSLVDMIRRHSNVTAVYTTPSDLQEIRSWLFKIGEPESLHHICLDKCKADPEAREYFLKHARGAFTDPG